MRGELSFGVAEWMHSLVLEKSLNYRAPLNVSQSLFSNFKIILVQVFNVLESFESLHLFSDTSKEKKELDDEHKEREVENWVWSIKWRRSYK